MAKPPNKICRGLCKEVLLRQEGESPVMFDKRVTCGKQRCVEAYRDLLQDRSRTANNSSRPYHQTSEWPEYMAITKPFANHG